MSSMNIRHRKGAASEVAVEDDDAVHGGRMKPLSSLGVSSAKKCFLAASNPSSQVHYLTRQRTKVICNTISLKDGRRHATLWMHSRNTKSKRFNYKRLNHKAIDRKVAALPRQIKEMSHCDDRNTHLKMKNTKDMDGAPHAMCKGFKTTLQVHENVDPGFREVAIPKKHPKLGARQAVELPSEMLRDNMNNAKSIKSMPSDAKSHRETNNPTSKAANDVAKRHNESLPYTAATSLQPAEEVFADIKTEKCEVDVITIGGLDSECEHTTLMLTTQVPLHQILQGLAKP
ncbi:hypothetical protein GOP47_0003784 [Adiantum capillus-veneris]|uniref:Uncharacterized protein n=1 Tax=Adiantum capillus-veneris TaxID=13818 RepID=A0A9D4V7B6_ADICA|nr:hypothetical protein GOP47_0003784 [Adiantum capillus-veneris]